MAFERTEGSRPARPMRRGRKKVCSFCDNMVKSLENKDTALQIHLILHELDEPYKEVFQLRIFGELPFSQIGMIFGKTENWARVTYHRARLKIKERMDRNE